MILQGYVDTLKEELAGQAGLDPMQDRFKAGAIQAYYDMLKIDYQEATDGN